MPHHTPATPLPGTLLVGVLMVAQQGFRNSGFALSRDSSVVTVLYTEIVFSFIWDLAIMGARPTAVEYAGATMIIVGSSGAAIMKGRRAAKAMEQDSPGKTPARGSLGTLNEDQGLIDDPDDDKPLSLDMPDDDLKPRDSVKSDAAPP